MPIREIFLRSGTSAEHASFTGDTREVSVDTTKKTLVVHDGETPGGFPAAKAAAVPTLLSQLTEDSGLWRKSVLTSLSQLTDDVGYWSNLTKVSQLTNDLNFKTAHCTYCTHCSYCQKCSRCNDKKCNNVQCNQVQCNQVQCSDCSQCVKCSYCDCDCNCSDDTD